jgi:hypothetical protein
VIALNFTCPTVDMERNSTFWLAVCLDSADGQARSNDVSEKANLPVVD